MSRIHALLVASSVLPAFARAVVAQGETVPAMDAYDGVHAAGMPLGLVAIAAGFVLAGAWLIFVSGRSRG